MNKAPSSDPKKKPKETLVLRAVAYGCASVTIAAASLAATCRRSLVAAATANSTERDASPICKNSRERFVWVHGFIVGCALGTGIFTIGLCIALWMAL